MRTMAGREKDLKAQKGSLLENKLKAKLRAVIYREDDMWFAHCLELDIVSEGETPSEAMSNLGDLCEMQVRVGLEEGDLASVFRPAPAETWKMFFLATKPQKKPFRSLRGFEARELTFT